jgi:hypothetical protein
MDSQTDAPSLAISQGPALLKATGIALLVAGVLLVTVVLPAEYGVDPLGTGRWVGLAEMSTTGAAIAEAEPPSGAPAMMPVQKGPLGEYAASYKYDAAEISLGPYEYVEYKYHLEQGAGMVFDWTSSAPVIHDFHGEPDGATKGSEQSFDKSNRRRASGSFTAPFSGIHGWYWENPGADTITVTLTSAGFYASALEIRSDRTRRQRTLRSPEALTAVPEGSGGRR